MSDKSGSLIVGGGHYRGGNSLASNLHNPDFSSQILECPASQVQDSRANSESTKSLDSRFRVLDSNLESNLAESKTRDSESATS